MNINHEFLNDKDDFFGNNDDEIIEENEKNFIIPFSLEIKNFNVPETQNEADLLDLIIEKGWNHPIAIINILKPMKINKLQ